MRKLLTRSAIAAAAVGAAVALVAPVARATAPATVVVSPDDLAVNHAVAVHRPKWFFYNDENDTIDNSLGSFAFGPATPPHGVGSAQISVSGTQRRNLATYQFGGTPLADITELGFTTYNPSAGNGGSSQRSAYLNVNVDFDGSDVWQKRLVFVPAQNGTVTQDSWQAWDAIAEGNALWTYSGPTWPVTGEAGSSPKSWAQILADYPGVRIRVTDSWLGLRVGEPYPDGYSEDIDSFTFGTAQGTTIFDFEPGRDQCKAGGWQMGGRADGSPFKNQGDCIQYVNTGR